MLSGLTKMIDPWGSQTKIEAYLSAWGLDDVFGPGIALMGGCVLSMVEFITGFLLATGSLRRTSAVAATAIMVFMLPLTAYIAMYNPVEDCGCFGDFLIISNVATFWKNVGLTALAIYLLVNNRRARCLFAPWVQWAQIAVAMAYMLVIGLIGYHEQPLLDFRAYPAGEPLTDGEGCTMTYLYRGKDGEIHEFSDDSLPDESDGWEFVDVREDEAASGKMFALFDRESGEDVTGEVVGATEGQMLLLIPDLSAATAAGSFTANELSSYMSRRYGEGAFVAVTEGDSARLEKALDLMMADYPFYLSDPKAIKAVARGQMSLVYLENDTVRWKRTLSSINLDRLTEEAELAEVYNPHGPRLFRAITLMAVLLEVVIMWLGTLTRVARWVGRVLRRG